MNLIELNSMMMIVHLRYIFGDFAIAATASVAAIIRLLLLYLDCNGISHYRPS